MNTFPPLPSLRLILFLILFPGILLPLWAQKTVQVTLVQANSMEFRKELGEDLRRVIGNVVFEHEGAMLYCDSAWFHETENRIDAYGTIRIRVNDTLNVYGDLLAYDGNTRLADLIGNVKLLDRTTSLETDRLLFDRTSGIASYHTGARMVNKDNQLVSKTGYYHTSNKQFFFKDSVVLTNPRYIMRSDSLMYHTFTRIAYFKGPTRITSKESFIYCENGWYNTLTDVAQFNRHAYLESKAQHLRGDSLYYDRNRGIGKAFRNVTLTDTVQDIIIKGHIGEYYRQQGYSLVTDSALGILVDTQDSLYLHADTLYATFDSLGTTRWLSSFHHVKFYRQDLQGLCDSLVYNLEDSTLTLFSGPVLWSEENQLTADSIRLWITNNQPDSMLLYRSAFIISRADSGKYNQIQGRRMAGYFRDRQLDHIRVHGNARTIYFAKEDDGSSIGINTAKASDMLIRLTEKKITSIKYISKPDAVLQPEEKVSEKDLILPGFQWFGHRRPSDRFSVFSW